MTTFRRIEDMQERQDTSGEYTTYDAFYYQGPFTDFPYWAQYSFTRGEMAMRNSVALLIGKGVRKYPEQLPVAANWPVAIGSWVMRIYHHVTKDNYTTELREYTTEELRREFFPTGTLEVDEAAEYFNVDDLTEGSVQLSIPVRFIAFQWKGEAHAVPWWVQKSLTDGSIVLKGASLYHMCEVARPKDWVLRGDNGKIKMMTDDEYRKAGGK